MKTIQWFAVFAALSLPSLSKAADHPARDKDVVERDDQRVRIDKGERDGNITPTEGARDRGQERRIGRETRDDASKDPGGHLDRTNRGEIRRQERRESDKIANQNGN